MNKNKITITTLLVLMFFVGFGIMATNYNAEDFSQASSREEVTSFHEEHVQVNG